MEELAQVFGTTNTNVVACLSSFLDVVAERVAYKLDDIRTAREKAEANAKPDELLSLKEVRELLHIDDTTLWRWRKKGYIDEPLEIGGKLCYKRSYIEEKFLTSKHLKNKDYEN